MKEMADISLGNHEDIETFEQDTRNIRTNKKLAA